MNTLSKEAGAELMVLLREPRQEARAAGGRAYYGGKSRHDNPYATGTPEAISWQAGWDVSQRFDEFCDYIKRRKAADDLIATFTNLVNEAVAQKRHVSMRRVGKKFSVVFSEFVQ